MINAGVEIQAAFVFLVVLVKGQIKTGGHAFQPPVLPSQFKAAKMDGRGMRDHAENGPDFGRIPRPQAAGATTRGLCPTSTTMAASTGD
jgi:hypothetical protein